MNVILGEIMNCIFHCIFKGKENIVKIITYFQENVQSLNIRTASDQTEYHNNPRANLFEMLKRVFPLRFDGLELPAGITLEAAFVLPLFMFAASILLTFISIMDDYRRVQNKMEALAKDVAQGAYVSSDSEGLLSKETSMSEFVRAAILGTQITLSSADILETFEGTGFSFPVVLPDTKILSDGEGSDKDMIHLEVAYSAKLPFGIFTPEKISLKSVVNRRAWTGSDGGRGRDKYNEKDDGEDEDPIVYVGKTSTRYHINARCHYLYNNLKTASEKEIADLRNEYGQKYHPCSSCKAKGAGSVYYFSSGTAYHSSENCKAICAYAKAVHLSEVEYLGPCSYCSKKG